MEVSPMQTTFSLSQLKLIKNLSQLHIPLAKSRVRNIHAVEGHEQISAIVHVK